MEPLHIRRTQLCLNFARKDLEKSKSFFMKVTRPTQTRSIQKLVKEYNCRTKRFQNSSIPYMSKLLNNQWIISSNCHLMDNGYGAQFMVLGHYIAHKFAVLYILPHVLKSAIYIWLESALHSIFQLWMSRNEGQSLCSHSLNFDLLSKSFGIYLNHTTVSPQNFGKSPTHQKSPFLEVSILGYGLSVRSHPPIHKNSNISTTNEGMFMKFEI